MFGEHAIEPILPGELFAPQLWPGPQVICRSYHFHMTETGSVNSHKLCFRHGNVTGNWILILDGKLLQSGFEPIVHRAFTISFEIDGEEASLSATGTATLGYSHTLYINGKEISELRESGKVDLGESFPVHISIPDSRTFHDGSKLVTMYQIYSLSGSVGRAIVERRYSDFVVLDKIIRNQLDSSDIQHLPKLPVKVLSPWVDQSNETFISNRRDVLQTYLCELMKHPLISTFSDFFCFVGMHPVTGDPLRKPLSTALIEDFKEESDES